METLKEKEIQKVAEKTPIKMPHTYVLLCGILIVIAVLTWIIPAGTFERTKNEVLNRVVVVPGSFKFVDRTPVGPFKAMMSLVKGMQETADIIFFIFFAYGFIYMLIKSGAFYGALGKLMNKMQHAEKLIFPTFMLIFGICGSTFGLYEETYGLLPAFMGISMALGYDALVGGAAVIVGTATGFAAATLNPFTIGVAAGIAETDLNTGLPFRIVCFIIFQGVAILYLSRYAAKVKANPELSIVKDVKFKISTDMTREKMINLPFTTRHVIIMMAFLATLVLLMFGCIKWGWYLNELSTLFLIMMIVVGLINRMSFSEIASSFVESISDVVFGALAVGVARSLTIVMQEGQIIDTIINYVSNPIASLPKSVAGIGMVIVQNFINFFIPSGSGQAAVSMPIMAPLADAISMNREVSVLAFQFGDGFSNMFWPTSAGTLCGLMGLPIDKWYKFITPLFVIMIALQFILIAVSTYIFV